MSDYPHILYYPVAIALSGELLEWLTVFGYVGLAAIACWGVMFAPIRKK